ncbi:MAG: hypothetical protein ACJ8F3_14790 [Xanthobacteraceae bacterium]
MKKLITTIAIAILIASPALAQTAVRRAPAQPTQVDQNSRAEVQRRANNQAVPVYEGNAYLGADPDPNVRLNLRMDYEHHD